MNKNEYDVVIIGAGVGGLICGCYLAKAGMKVLIAEKNSWVGGFCRSFYRKEFHFDAFVHSFGSLSKDGRLNKILRDFNILNKLDMTRSNPSDTIITPDLRLSFWNDIGKTIVDFKKAFPEELNIEKFFSDILNETNMQAVYSFRNKTFRNVLDEYFDSDKLKKILSFVILGNLGVPSYRINGFTAIKHYKQFIFDGGYCPRKGVQELPNMLAEVFTEMGGTLSLSTKCKKIITQKGVVDSVILSNSEVIKTQFVVTACDARETLFDLVGKEVLDRNIVSKVNKMKPSYSIFIVYLGLKENLKDKAYDGTNTWVMCNYEYENVYSNWNDLELGCLMLKPNYSKNNCVILTTVPFMNNKFWNHNKNAFKNKLIDKAVTIIPYLSNFIIFKSSADPRVLYRSTMNYNGAAYGWESVPSQFMDPDFTRDKNVKNLFFCGHWSTLGQGIPGVAIVGQRVARIILNRQATS